MSPRHDGRKVDQLRPIKIDRDFVSAAPGRVLVSAGNTVILCTASVENSVPPWMVGKGRGWITAEYNMLPGSTHPRKRRDRGTKVDGRTTEIQRLIGRSLRAVANLDQLGERSVTVDCDVLQADGGTRTLSITGGLIALVDALTNSEAKTPEPPAVLRDTPRNTLRDILRESVAAVSVGVVDGRPVLDLDYKEDFAAAVDMNVVMTASGQFVELQGTGEEATFSDAELTALVALARGGIKQLVAQQREALGTAWPW